MQVDLVLDGDVDGIGGIHEIYKWEFTIDNSGPPFEIVNGES
jgi:hypothetical protein